MTAFILKIIAIVAMTLNHIGHGFGEYLPDGLYYVCIGVGGMTFPIMAYLMSDGYKCTSNVKKYALRLLVFAVIALVPFWMATGYYALNVLFTLLIGLWMLYLNEHMKSRVAFWLIFVLMTALTIFCDWSLMGVPMILLYYKLENRYARVIVPLTLVWGFMSLNCISAILIPDAMSQREIIANMLYAFGGSTLTIPLLLNYNGERGRSMKYLFYAYYPAHLLVIGIIVKLLAA